MAGIDGTATFAVDSLALVSLRVAWQSKKYAPEHKIQPAAIREFRGAMDQGFQHRVFFTTSTFTVMSASAKPKMRPCIRPLLMAPLPGLVTAWGWLPAPAAYEQHQPRAA